MACQDVQQNYGCHAHHLTGLFELLGEPDYSKEDHHYYRITETRLGIWTLTTKTMVVKFTNDTSIEWIKIHE